MNDRANTRKPFHNNSTTYKTYHTRRYCAFLIAEVWTNETGMRETTPLICVQNEPEFETHGRSESLLLLFCLWKRETD